LTQEQETASASGFTRSFSNSYLVEIHDIDQFGRLQVEFGKAIARSQGEAG
jgi:hypothetical protein